MPRGAAGHGEHFPVDELATIFSGAVEVKVVLLSKLSERFRGHSLLLQELKTKVGGGPKAKPRNQAINLVPGFPTRTTLTEVRSY